MKYDYGKQCWEALPNSYSNQQTERMLVPGGWIVKQTEWSPQEGPSIAVALCFVPDPNHEWEVR